MKVRKFGRRYDTDTALVCGVFGSFSAWDINCRYEVLYRKRTGEYFLYVFGGANTRFGAAEHIYLISRDNAKLWLQGVDVWFLANDDGDILNECTPYLLSRNSAFFGEREIKCLC